MKVVIVTGDTGGVGVETVKAIMSETDYNVVGISRKENENTKYLMTQYGDRYCHINYDLKDVEGIKKLYSKKIKPLGKIVGLVNNSAFAYDDIVTNTNYNSLSDMFNVNVFSAMMLTKYAIRDMILNKVKGSIVHVTSVCASTGYKGLSMYGATKGAMESYSTGVAREWGELGIRSNCVAPGFMDTNMSATLSEDQKNRIFKRTSMKEDTNVESVAQTIAFLLTDKAKSVTGTTLHVDNGTL